MEQNPYESPSATLVAGESVVGKLGEPKHCPASAGSSWFSEGFRLFKSQLGMWLAIYLIFLVLYFAINLIPIVSYLWWVVAGIFSGGLFYAARETDVGDGPEVGHLFIGFKKNASSLVLLGLMTAGAYMAALILAFIIALVVTGAMGGFNLDMLLGGGQPDPEKFAALLPAIFVFIILCLCFMLPVLMCQLFSPALVMLNDVAPVEAMKMSFVASSRNIGSLTIWSLLCIVALLAGLLCLIVGVIFVSPAIHLSTYAAYKNIFLNEEMAA